VTVIFLSFTVYLSIKYLSTKNQSIRYNFQRVTIYKKPKLNKSPHRKGTVMRLRICTPRKPNSARRPVVKGVLSTFKKVLAHIPGSGHTLRRHSRILISGNAARDLPVVNYTCIRGVYDFEPLSNKRFRRSIYGVSLPSELRKHVRRNIRHLV
jgi:small subunit ribosomal protein S12